MPATEKAAPEPAEPPAIASAAVALPPTPPVAAATPAPAPAGTATTLEAGTGFTVQVTVVGDRAKADALVRRLMQKGFPAYVASPAAGATTLFRVRVGRYAERPEAERIARRLEQEEQFKPWITR